MSCILIASYINHLEYLKKFLFTLNKLTPNNLPVYIIIGKEDFPRFCSFQVNYTNVHLLIFSKIVELLEDRKIDDIRLLKDYGKYRYQSLKKYYGLYYLFYRYSYQNIIIFDSE